MPKEIYMSVESNFITEFQVNFSVPEWTLHKQLMIYLYIDIVMLPVCTQSEKLSPSIPRAADPESSLAPVKASNCPSVEECRSVWNI
jgi:hypothetical protein